MKLITNWEQFSSQIDEYLNESQNILNKKNQITSDDELEEVKEEIQDWTKRCFNFLNDSFDVEQNEFAHSFFYARDNEYQIGGFKKDFRQLKEKVFNDLNEKVRILQYFKRILSISDAIIKPEVTDLGYRENYTTEQTLELILDKLYELYDNSYHPIARLMVGNGIPLKRDSEDRELGITLEENDFVELHPADKSMAQLKFRERCMLKKREKHTKKIMKILIKAKMKLTLKLTK